MKNNYITKKMNIVKEERVLQTEGGMRREVRQPIINVSRMRSRGWDNNNPFLIIYNRIAVFEMIYFAMPWVNKS